MKKYIVPLVLIGLAAALILWTDGPLDVDDALITYRYAENIATGQGFAYNVGEQILGTSTPLYTLLIAAGYAVGIPTLTVSALLNFAGSLAVVWLTLAITSRLSGSLYAGIIGASFLLLQGSFLRYTMAGMETPLYTLLILCAFWYILLERYTWAAVMAGLAAVMRLDGLAVGGALFLAYLLHQRRLPWRALLVYLAILSPWLLFATLYFGSPLPHSMIAKQTHLKVYGHNRFWIWDYLFTNHYATPTTLLAMIPVGLLTLLQRRRSYQTITTIIIWCVTYLIAYTLVGIDFYEWYVVPIYPALSILIGAGLYGMGAAFAAWIPTKLWSYLARAVNVVVLLYVLFPYGEHAYSTVVSFQGYLRDVEGPRNQAGRWIQAQTAPDSIVLAGAIGHLGYYSKRYILDGARLVTRPEQLTTTRPDFYAIDGGVPDDAACGPIKEFHPPPGAANPPIIISACHRQPLATIANLSLFNIRIGQHVRKPNLHWATLDEPHLELQWRIQGTLPNGEWAVYMHYLDAEGNVLTQTDHPLGRQITGYIRPQTNWSENLRIYTYVDLPDDWAALKPQITAIRLGIWDPGTHEYLPITPLHPELVLAGGLFIPFHHGDFLLGNTQ